MKYIKLIDYLDRPELIQHENNVDVRALHYFPERESYHKVVVVYEDGTTCSYSEDGLYNANAKPCFVLKPNRDKESET